MDFSFKTPPMPHQLKLWERTRDLPFFALHMEQRTRKTKIVLDTVAWLFCNGANALFVVAPNGVHRNWVTDEIPKHLPDWTNYRCLIWRSGRYGTKTAAEEREALLKHAGLAVLAMNVEALRTDKAQAYARTFLKTRLALFAVDESGCISGPKAIQTKAVLKLAALAPYRRVLDGTPSVEGPFRLWAPYQFLSPDILEAPRFTLFRARYGVWKEGFNHNTGRRYPVLEGYRNLEDLKRRTAPYSYRITRAELGALPPTFTREYFELTPAQRRVYNELREIYVTELDGKTLTASMVLTRYLRLQQVASNFWPPERDAVAHKPCDGEGCPDCQFTGFVEQTSGLKVVDPHVNPRVEALRALVQKENSVQGVIWCRFQRDVDDALGLLDELDMTAAQFDGRCHPELLDASRRKFQAHGIQWLVANPAKGAFGFEFSAAELSVFYSNYFSLRLRQQSQDRVETLDQKRSKGVVDLVAEDTVDEIIVQAHNDKRSLSDYLLDRAKIPNEKWI